MATGWHVLLKFSITLHVRDRALLEKIKRFLGVNKITKQGRDLIQLLASSKEDLLKFIKHFDKFPLLTKNSQIMNFESKRIILCKRKNI